MTATLQRRGVLSPFNIKSIISCCRYIDKLIGKSFDFFFFYHSVGPFGATFNAGRHRERAARTTRAAGGGGGLRSDPSMHDDDASFFFSR